MVFWNQNNKVAKTEPHNEIFDKTVEIDNAEITTIAANLYNYNEVTEHKVHLKKCSF